MNEHAAVALTRLRKDVADGRLAVVSGASAVEIASPVMVHGFGLLQRTVEELRRFLECRDWTLAT